LLPEHNRQEHRPDRLTAKGRDLWPIMTAMRQWGDKYAAPDGLPLKLVHKKCGTVSQPVMTCSACGEPLSARDVRAVAGPGDLDHLVPVAALGR
jgi:hypothetical protein